MMRRLALCLALALAACADIPVDAPVDVKVPIKVDAPVNITIHCERCTVLPEGFTLGGVIRGLMNPPKPDADPPPASVPDPSYRPKAPPAANPAGQRDRGADGSTSALRLPDLGWWPFGKRQEN